MSLVYPRMHRGSVLMRSPPQVLLVWPKVLSLRAGVKDVKFKHEEFDKTGAIVQFTVSISFFEIILIPRYADEIREIGSMRGSKSGLLTVD